MLKAFRKILLPLLALSLAVVSCGDPHDVDIVSYSVANVSLKGLRSVGADLVLEIDNPSVRFKVHDIKGCLRQGDAVLVTFSAEDMVLDGHSRRKYVLPCVATLGESFSIIGVAGMLGNVKESDLKLDVSCECRAIGIRKKVERKGISVSKLIET